MITHCPNIQTFIDTSAMHDKIIMSLVNSMPQPFKEADASVKEEFFPDNTYIPSYLRPLAENPEAEAQERLNIGNMVDIEPEDISTVKKVASKMTKDVSSLLIERGSAMLISFDNATSYTEAFLRDGMGINVDMDTSITAGIESLLKLSILNYYAHKLDIPQPLRDLFLRTLTRKTAESTHDQMLSNLKSEKYSAMLRNLHGKIGKTGKYAKEPGLSSPIGLARPGSRSGPTEDMHRQNEEQNNGVRFEYDR